MKLNTGIVIGLVGGLIGGLIGVAVAFVAEPIMGVFVTCFTIPMFFIMYWAFIKPSIEYNRLLKTGIKATGRILSITETSTRINRQPLCKLELQIEIPGTPAYIVTTKTVISYFQASQYQPGTVVHVMVDSNNKMKCVLVRQEDFNKGDFNKGDLNTQASTENIAALKEKLAEMEVENNAIKATGIYCKAIVIKFTNMGVNINGDNPLTTIDLQVLPDNEPAFSATTKGVIKNSSVHLFQPGEEIFVKYNPIDKTKVVIEHS